MQKMIDRDYVDKEHIINKEVNDCKVTIYFTQKRNQKIEREILENLLDTFEKRINSQIAG